MGCVINPIAFRVGYVRSWNDAWYLKFNYSNFFHDTLRYKSIFFYVLFFIFPGQKSKWMYSHISFVFSKGKIFINIFLYDGVDNDLFKSLSKKMRYGFFSRIWFKSFWLKKRVLHKRFLAQRFVFLSQMLNVFYDSFNLDTLKNIFRKKHWEIAKIMKLRGKYGPQWTSREEASAFIYPLLFFNKRRYNKMGLHFLYAYFKSRYLNNFSKDGFMVRRSYIKLFFFLSFLDKVFSIHPSYPVLPFRLSNYRRIFKIYFIWFVQRPILKNFFRLFEYMCYMLNINNFNIELFLLQNPNLSADFISRFIITAFAKGFYYKDIIVPIRKSLDRQLKIKKFLSNRKSVNPYYLKIYNKFMQHKKRSIRFFRLIVYFIFLRFRHKVIYHTFKRVILKSRYMRSILYANVINLKLCFKKKILNIFDSQMFYLNKTFFILNLWKRKFLLILKHTYVFFKTKLSFKYDNFFYLLRLFNNLLICKKLYILLKNFTFFNKVNYNNKFKYDQQKKIDYNNKFKYDQRKKIDYNNKFKYDQRKKIDYIDKSKYGVQKRLKLRNNFRKLIYFFKMFRFFLPLLFVNNNNFLKIFYFNKKFRFDLDYLIFKNLIFLKKNRLKRFRFKQIRKISSIIFLFYLKFYSKHYKFFGLNIRSFLKRERNIYLLNKVNNVNKVIENKKETPLLRKINKRNAIKGNFSNLLGYKMHFVGRFTRRQRAANLWFLKGSLSNSSFEANVDYGVNTLPLVYSACTVKVWLYKSSNYKTYNYKFKFK